MQIDIDTSLSVSFVSHPFPMRLLLYVFMALCQIRVIVELLVYCLRQACRECIANASAFRITPATLSSKCIIVFTIVGADWERHNLIHYNLL